MITTVLIFITSIGLAYVRNRKYIKYVGKIVDRYWNKRLKGWDKVIYAVQIAQLSKKVSQLLDNIFEYIRLETFDEDIQTIFGRLDTLKRGLTR